MFYELLNLHTNLHDDTRQQMEVLREVSFLHSTKQVYIFTAFTQ
jgi:hypothetical protein